MKTSSIKISLLAAALMVASGAFAEVMDRPTGFRIGQHMTLKPYVNISFAYDSNPDQQPSQEGVGSFIINPGLALTYRADNWSLDVAAFYRYTAYTRYVNQLNSHDYGENINYKWSNARADEKGWALLLTESFQRVNEDDDMLQTDGRGLWRDRMEFKIGGALERRFTDKFHGAVNASYYMLDYDNDGESYGALYGWQRWVGGLEAGYAMSRWTDFLVTGNYQRYYQDNSTDLSGYSSYYGTDGKYSRESQGYTAMVGLGSYATERITYRVLGGWSYFNYGDYASCNGFTYSVSGNWKITDTLSTMLLAQSQYQPDERQYGSANRVDSISWGIAKSFIRNKLTTSLDLAWRRETREYTDESAQDYDEDILSARIGANYVLNRFFTLFANLVYEHAWFDGNGSSYNDIDRDYNRFRGTVGVRLTY